MRYASVCAFAAVSLISASALAADFNVTVGSDSGGLRWNINGQLSPTLTLNRGQTYTFAVNASGHPFDIKTAQVTGTASQFNTGVTNQGASNGSGTLTFAVPTGPTPPLFYQCEVHSTMTGAIQLVGTPSPWAPTSPALMIGLLALTLCGGGFLALRSRSLTA